MAILCLKQKMMNSGGRAGRSVRECGQNPGNGVWGGVPGSLCAPTDKAIGANQRRARRCNAKCLRKQPFGIGQPGTNAAHIEFDPLAGGGRKRTVAPGRTFRTRQQHKLRAEQIQRGKAVSAPLQPDMRGSGAGSTPGFPRVLMERRRTS